MCKIKCKIHSIIILLNTKGDKLIFNLAAWKNSLCMYFHDQIEILYNPVKPKSVNSKYVFILLLILSHYAKFAWYVKQIRKNELEGISFLFNVYGVLVVHCYYYNESVFQNYGNNFKKNLNIMLFCQLMYSCFLCLCLINIF